MKKICKFLLVFLCCFDLSAQEKVNLDGGNICPSEWKLVFSDEFSGSSLDLSKWYTYYPYTPDHSDQCDFCRTHGNEGQIYRNDNIVVGNGTLKLIAKAQASTWFSSSRNYTSGMIHSKIDNFHRGK